VNVVTVWCDYANGSAPSIKLPDIKLAETIWLVKGRKKDKWTDTKEERNVAKRPYVWMDG
jgi:hypothetical protein